MWTKTDPDIPAEGNFDPDIGENSALDLDTEPLRYEDVLQQYLEKDPTLSAGDIPSIADLSVDYATDIEVIPKTKEQLISELAPKIQKTGITPGRAAIAAQEMYVKAEERFGSDMDAVLESYQPGQNPRKFLDGFQNAYLSGKLGDKAALENSTAAAYLTEEQKTLAYEIGENSGTYANYSVQQGRLVHKDGVLGASGNVGEKAKPYSQRGIQIEHRLQSYLNKLQRDGDHITVPIGEIRNRDLAVLTTETGVEFTLVNAAGKTFLIRGGENFTTIPQEILNLVIDSRGAIECHSHPYIGDIVPSDADKRMMELLTWVQESTIIDPTEKTARFNSLGVIDTGTEASDRNEDYYKDMIWGGGIIKWKKEIWLGLQPRRLLSCLARNTCVVHIMAHVHLEVWLMMKHSYFSLVLKEVGIYRTGRPMIMAGLYMQKC